MNISEFLEETLVGIKRGIEEANKKSGSKSDQFKMMRDDRIDFDIALAVSDSVGKKGAARIAIIPIVTAEGGAHVENRSEQTSRIKFSIKVKYNEFGYTAEQVNE